jgi:hypothetical protein
MKPLCKHEHTQFLCDSIEAARPHIPFQIETHIAQVFPDIPVLLVHRVYTYKPASNLARVTQRELLATLSVTADYKLHIHNHESDAEGSDFHALVQPLIHPEQYPAFAQ